MIPLELTISMSVLEDLGINLYGNVPAVLSEAVSNSWDADATEVKISYSKTNGTITIADNGLGMTRTELQSFYLTVGHKRRVAGRTITPGGRSPMGRKGIGKLSLFSIAEIVDVETTKDGERTAIRMDVNEIQAAIKAAQKQAVGDTAGRYKPLELPGTWDFTRGTRITLRNLRKNRVRLGADLRRRLARRFYVVGSQSDFHVIVEGQPLTIEDRGYINLIEYLWVLDNGSYSAVADKIRPHVQNVQTIKLEATDPSIGGWIGTASNSGDLTKGGDDANAIALVVRGKLAAPDILGRFGIGELASKYMVGEIHADFLDDDSLEDIATSNRQGFLEDDDRFVHLIAVVKRIVRQVVNDRHRLKKKAAEESAIKLIPELEEWLKSLSGDRREAARDLLGSINNIYEDDEAAKREHFKQAIVAHQIFDARGRLKRLEDLADQDTKTVLAAFNDFDQYEAALYHDVAKIRVDVIRTLETEFLSKNKLEALIRDYLAEHLWLLDPSWDRATEPVAIEKSVKKYLDKAADSLSKEERDSRFDIVYRRGPRRHVVVELKKYARSVTPGELIDQIGKYAGALRKALTDINEPYDAHEIVCLIGPKQEFLATEESRRNAEASLAPYNGRLMTYDEMLDRAQKAYSDFLISEEKKNKLVKLLNSITS